MKTIRCEKCGTLHGLASPNSDENAEYLCVVCACIAIDALRDENARLKLERDTARQTLQQSITNCGSLESSLAALTAERDAAKRDSERLDWLAEQYRRERKSYSDADVATGGKEWPMDEVTLLGHAEINAAVAERVAGWKRNEKAVLLWHIPSGEKQFTPPDYLHDADAVIKLLEKQWYWVADNGAIKPEGGHKYHVRVGRLTLKGEGCGDADTFCRAACLALLAAHGTQSQS